MLGLMHEYGYGTKEDPERAYALYMAGQKSGNQSAACALSNHLMRQINRMYDAGTQDTLRGRVMREDSSMWLQRCVNRLKRETSSGFEPWRRVGEARMATVESECPADRETNLLAYQTF